MADFPTNGDDIIFGTEEDDNIDALGGNDTLFGMGGRDILWGGDGNDLLNGGLGENNLNGGKGFDTANYALSIVSMDVNLTRGWGAPSGHGLDDMDWYTSIENIEGGAGDDLLIGNRGQNFIGGNKGKDTIKGGSGSDSLSGGDGNDKLYGGAEADIVDGGTGDDVVEGGTGADVLIGGSDGKFGDALSYANSPVGVVIDLAINFAAHGDAEGDKISGFEGVIGSEFGDDLLGNRKANEFMAGNTGDEIEGRSGNDVIYGRGGDDNIRGGGDDDFIEGNGGVDDIWGGTGKDVFNYRAADDSGLEAIDRDIFHDFNPDEDLIGFSVMEGDGNFIGTAGFSAGVANQVRYANTKNKTIVSVDFDGDASADMKFTLIGAFELNDANFIM